MIEFVFGAACALAVEFAAKKAKAAYEAHKASVAAKVASAEAEAQAKFEAAVKAAVAKVSPPSA